jgi:hypothetical protein
MGARIMIGTLAEPIWSSAKIAATNAIGAASLAESSSGLQFQLPLEI